MLVDSLLRKAMYNLKENEWTPDQRESFRCYRTDIADTIMYCFNILRVNDKEYVISFVYITVKIISDGTCLKN